jgi:uncharacterized membrane protein
MHIELDWDERDVVAAMAVLGIIIAAGEQAYDARPEGIVDAAYEIADAFEDYAKGKPFRVLDRRLRRGEIDEETFNRLVDELP